MQLLHRSLISFFAVGIVISFFATEALAINSSHAQIYGYNSDFSSLLFSSDGSGPTNATTTFTYSPNGFSAEATGAANGFDLGAEGHAFVGSNASNYLFVTASGNYRDVITFNQGGIVNLDNELTGLSWRDTSYAYSSNSISVTGLLLSGDGNTSLGSDADYLYPPVVITSDPSSTPPGLLTGTLRIDSASSPGSPFMMTAGTPYTLSWSLLSTIVFNPGVYVNVSGGFDFVNTLTITDLYLTDLDGNRIPFSYSSSEGVTYPTSRSVPEPTTLALFGLGLAGLGAVRRKKQAA